MTRPTDDGRCILCGRRLPADRRWRIVRVLAPRFPRCDPPDAACFRGLAEHIGANPSDDQVRDAVRRASR